MRHDGGNGGPPSSLSFLSQTLKFYASRVQIPLFCTVLVALWIVVTVRCWGVRRRHMWRSLQGVSSVLILFANALCTAYVVLTIALHVIIPEPEEVDFENMRPLLPIPGALRIMLTLALWAVKFAFVTILLQTRTGLRKEPWALQVLYGTAFALVVVFAVALWVVVKDVQPQLAFYRQHLGFFKHVDRASISEIMSSAELWNGADELVLGAFNIGTDILLLIVATYILLALKISLRATSVITVMITISVSIALIRLVIVATGPDVTQEVAGPASYSPVGEVAFEVLTSIEPFFATIASCLPELRVWIRSRGAQQKKKRALFSVVDVEPEPWTGRLESALPVRDEEES